MSSDEKVALLSSEKDLKLQKILNTDFKNESVCKYDKSEVHQDETDFARRGSCPSLFSFLHVELTRGYVLEHDQERYSARREKVYSFMKIPRELEKFMTYGFLQCIDSFLFVYTFLPIRVILAVWAVFARSFSRCFGIRERTKSKGLLTPAEICDLLKASLILFCSTLMYYIDTNMMYHLIKSQSVIKLYIFYNILEVGDRLFSAFGQDTIDALYWTATEPRGRRREHFGVIPHLLFAIIYVFFHSILVLFQATTLNVAINSNNKALLTIMMSNNVSCHSMLVILQATTLNVAVNSSDRDFFSIVMLLNFVELKGSVFKKFDKNNLFQVSCSDVRERFHLVVLLFIVVMQTMKEYSWRMERFWVLVPDCLMVIIAEILVDWIKHAFITRFNELQVEEVYRDYTISLAYDVAQTRQKHAFSDHSDLVARRMGFIPIPLGVVMIRVLAQALHISNIPALLLIILAYICTFSYKILNSILILGKACSLITQHKQEKASVQSPSNNNRASSPLTVNSQIKTQTSKELFKDCATSPLKPNIDSPILQQPVINGLNKCVKIVEPDLPPNDLSLESAALFSNSTVDLKTASLNEELLKVEGDNIKIESVIDKTRSDPNINCDYVDDSLEDTLCEPVENTIKKRAESEPNLA